MTPRRPKSRIARLTNGRRLRTAAAIGIVLTGSLAAQKPPSWSSIAIAGIRSSAVQQLGKLAYYRVGATIHVYSSIARAWKTVAVTGAATIRMSNNWLVIHQGQLVTAYSAFGGSFEKLTVSASAKIVTPPSNRNDEILLIQDGNTLHAFSGLVGRWNNHPITVAAKISTNRDVAIIADKDKLIAMSASVGEWVSQRSDGPVNSIEAIDRMGLVTTARSTYGFSAIRNTWSQVQSLPNATLKREGDVAIWSNSQHCLGFSSLRGTFRLQVTGNATVVTATTRTAVARTGNIAFIFSAPLARWLVMSTAGTMQMHAKGSLINFFGAQKITSYSALTGTTASLKGTNITSLFNSTVTAASVSGAWHMFSAMSGKWTKAPAATKTPICLVQNGALLAASGSVLAFSPRSDNFIRLATTTSAIHHANQGSSVIAVQDGANLHAFDARREIWVHHPCLTSKPLRVRLWRTTMVATSSSNAFGFSAQHGEIERAPLPETVLDLRASSEVGAVITSNHILAFSSVADLITPVQFPEFRRMCGRGTKLTLTLSGKPRAGHVIFIGFPSASTLQLPIGDIVLASNPLVPLPGGTLPPSGHAHTQIKIPDQPRFSGLNLGMQAAILPQAGSPYLTRMGSLSIY